MGGGGLTDNVVVTAKRAERKRLLKVRRLPLLLVFGKVHDESPVSVDRAIKKQNFTVEDEEQGRDWS